MAGWVHRWNLENPDSGDSAMKPYAERVKPFNFLWRVGVDPFNGKPHHAPRDKPFNLVSPYGERERWINLHDPSGAVYTVTTVDPLAEVTDKAFVYSYQQRITSHPYNEESKSLAPDGSPAWKQSRGLLKRQRFTPVSHATSGRNLTSLSVLMLDW